MWGLLILFSPFIYIIYSSISDYIREIDKCNKYKTEEIQRKKYYGKEELFCLDSYQNKNITDDDIMEHFLSQIKRYRETYYILTYKIYTEKEKQNYAWSVRTSKDVFGWGTIYNVNFYFSNGWVDFKTSSSNFEADNKPAGYYYANSYDLGSYNIDNELSRCLEESRLTWKMNDKKPHGNKPFNFILVENRYYKSEKKYNSNTNSTNTEQQDLFVFYRSLLGLKLNFNLEELKKSYHNAVKKYHPDSYGTSSHRDRENAEVLMKQINEAYDRLKDLVT